jgi:hypothetical protein
MAPTSSSCPVATLITKSWASSLVRARRRPSKPQNAMTAASASRLMPSMSARLRASRGGLQRPVVAHCGAGSQRLLPRRAAAREVSCRSLAEPLQGLGVAGQFLVEDLVEQFGAAVVLHVLADRLPGHFLHGPLLQFCAPPQRVGFIVGKPQSHRHACNGITDDTE